MITWIEHQIDDPRIFPPPNSQQSTYIVFVISRPVVHNSCTEVAYPADFRVRVSGIFRRLFRVFAHIYYSHFEQMVSLDADKHLNTAFKHFVFFIKEFDLVPANQLTPMADLIAKIERSDFDVDQKPTTALL